MQYHVSKNTPLLSISCGLGYFASVIKNHYIDEAQRHNKPPVRLIRDQAISLTNFSRRLTDDLKISDEMNVMMRKSKMRPAQKLKGLALGKIAELLRNAVRYLIKLQLALLMLASFRNFVLYIVTCMYYFFKWM